MGWEKVTSSCYIQWSLWYHDYSPVWWLPSSCPCYPGLITPHNAKSSMAFPSGNVMLQLPGKIDKESKANRAIIKLMLLHIHGNFDINSMLITNLTLATPPKGIQVVMNQPHAAQAGQFADLVRMTFDLDKQQDYTNFCSSQVSIWIMSKVLASHMLQGNFATQKVISLKNEAHSIEPSAFLLQKNACLVECERSTEVKATLENVMDFTNSQKTKGKTAISCIGTMTSLVNFSSLCISMNTIIIAICSRKSAPATSLSQFFVRSFSIFLPSSIILIGYIGRRVLAECNCFIGTPTSFLSKSSIALPILIQISGMEMLYPRDTQLPSSIPMH